MNSGEAGIFSIPVINMKIQMRQLMRMSTVDICYVERKNVQE